MSQGFGVMSAVLQLPLPVAKIQWFLLAALVSEAAPCLIKFIFTILHSSDNFTVPRLLAVQPHPSLTSIHAEALPSLPSIPSSTSPIQTLGQLTNSGADGIRPLPEQGLVIPAVPAKRADGSFPPRAESWKQIVQHWLEGDPTRGLHHPLRDWPADWIRGKNKALFASKYKQRAVIALEFLDR